MVHLGLAWQGMVCCAGQFKTKVCASTISFSSPIFLITGLFLELSIYAVRVGQTYNIHRQGVHHIILILLTICNELLNRMYPCSFHL